LVWKYSIVREHILFARQTRCKWWVVLISGNSLDVTQFLLGTAIDMESLMFWFEIENLGNVPSVKIEVELIKYEVELVQNYRIILVYRFTKISFMSLSYKIWISKFKMAEGSVWDLSRILSLTNGLKLGCLHPVAYIRSGSGVSV
jgi:hypothetical protein